MKSVFDKIKLNYLYTLCNTIAEAQIRHVSNVKRKYLENAMAFDETLLLLKDLKIVKYHPDESLSVKPIFTSQHAIEDFKKTFLPLLFSENGEVSEQLRSFLLNFQIENNLIFFKATEIQKIKFSSVRNLLLELEFIKASGDKTTYFVNSDFTFLFLKQLSKRKLSPAAFKRKLAEKDAIGFRAEMAVIEFEIQRLTDIPLLPGDIQHTSQENVLAGYDIKSFENFLDSDLNRIQRYIEVKAVPLEDFKFYWSRNEIEVSSVLREKYHLYLLPVISNNTFAVEKMVIIKNPFKEVYSNQIDWNKEEELVCLTKKM